MSANNDLGNAKMLKICFVTGMWQRPDVFRMFAEGIKYLQSYFIEDVQLCCAVAGSEGNVSKELAEGYGFHYVEVPNHPLGVKMNKALELARTLAPDYCLMVGSDDLIGTKLMRRYLSCASNKIDFVALMDCYFFDTRSKQGLYWAGYNKPHNKGKALGMGKLISASLLDKINWVCFLPGFDKILDTGFEKRLEKIQHSEEKIWLQHENLFALDIKSSTNMTPFRRWDNSNFMDGRALLFKNLPEPLAQMIYAG